MLRSGILVEGIPVAFAAHKATLNKRILSAISLIRVPDAAPHANLTLVFA